MGKRDSVFCIKFDACTVPARILHVQCTAWFVRKMLESEPFSHPDDPVRRNGVGIVHLVQNVWNCGVFMVLLLKLFYFTRGMTMFKSILKCGALAAGLSVMATSSFAASLGLATTGATDTATGSFDTFGGTGSFSAFPDFATGGPSNFFYDIFDLSFSSFDQGADVASVVDYGYAGNLLEFELSAFDGYGDGALLTVVLQGGTAYATDPIAAIYDTLADVATPAQFSLQALGVTAVPVPAGALLLGTALAGFGFVRRKRS